MKCSNYHPSRENGHVNDTNGVNKYQELNGKMLKVKVFDNKLKLFIKNIPHDGDGVKSKIQHLISPYGEIIHEWYFARRRGRNSVYTALLVMKTESVVKKALQVHGSCVEGRHILVSSYGQYTAHPNSVHIRNLSCDLTEEDLWQLFENIGKILFINIKNPVNLNVSNQPLVGEIVFETREAADKALSLNGIDLRGRSLEISLAAQREKDDHADLSVYVSGLPQGITKEKVIEFFDKCGVVRMVKVNFKNLSAVVHFTTKEAVNSAVKLNGEYLENNQVEVRERRAEVLHLAGGNLIYLSNIHKDVKDVDLFLAFQDCGYIVKVNFLSRKKNASKKRAVIEFQYPDSIAKAVLLDGLTIGGGPIRVSNSEFSNSTKESNQSSLEKQNKQKQNSNKSSIKGKHAAGKIKSSEEVAGDAQYEPSNKKNKKEHVI